MKRMSILDFNKDLKTDYNFQCTGIIEMFNMGYLYADQGNRYIELTKYIMVYANCVILKVGT